MAEDSPKKRRTGLYAAIGVGIALAVVGMASYALYGKVFIAPVNVEQDKQISTVDPQTLLDDDGDRYSNAYENAHGLNPQAKDIQLMVHVQNPEKHPEINAVMDQVAKEFKDNYPIKNKDGSSGINVHVLYDEKNPMPANAAYDDGGVLKYVNDVANADVKHQYIHAYLLDKHCAPENSQNFEGCHRAGQSFGHGYTLYITSQVDGRLSEFDALVKDNEHEIDHGILGPNHNNINGDILNPRALAEDRRFAPEIRQHLSEGKLYAHVPEDFIVND